MLEPRHFALEVDARDQSTQLRLQFVVVEVRRPTAVARVYGDTVVPGVMQGLRRHAQRRHDGNLLRARAMCERVLLEDRIVTPAPRPVELGHDRYVVFDADLVDAILVAVQREKTSVTAKSHLVQRCEDILGLQVGERQRGRDRSRRFLARFPFAVGLRQELLAQPQVCRA